jgi:anti-sigma factor RsiW
MTHRHWEELLGDDLDGLLDAARRRELETHLRGCAECSRTAESLASTVRTLRAFPDLDVPSGFTEEILRRTTRRNPVGAFWEFPWLGLRIPRVTPLGAAALLALPLFLLVGSPRGRQVLREASMATHRTYSDAVRLYYRSEDLKETAVALGEKLPGRLEQSMGWLRQRFGKEEGPRQPPSKPPNGEQKSWLPVADHRRA